MESWRTVWRAFVKAAPIELGEDGLKKGLTAMLHALVEDQDILVQGSTTTPPPLMCVQDWPVEAADAIGFLGWKSGKLPVVLDRGQETCSVGDIEVCFARLCYEADRVLGEPAACRWFLNFFDDTPRDRMRSEFLPEVRFALDPSIGDPVETGNTFEQLREKVGTPVPF